MLSVDTFAMVETIFSFVIEKIKNFLPHRQRAHSHPRKVNRMHSHSGRLALGAACLARSPQTRKDSDVYGAMYP